MNETVYIVVQWPEVQDLMEESWFDEECFLVNDDNGLTQFGSSAYFVPKHRYEYFCEWGKTIEE